MIGSGVREVGIEGRAKEEEVEDDKTRLRDLWFSVRFLERPWILRARPLGRGDRPGGGGFRKNTDLRPSRGRA